MSDHYVNGTGCEVSRSHITGDIVCQSPGPDCDCLIVAIDRELDAMVEVCPDCEGMGVFCPRCKGCGEVIR